MDENVISLVELLVGKGIVIAVAVAIALVVQRVTVRLANKALDASDVPNARSSGPSRSSR